MKSQFFAAAFAAATLAVSAGSTNDVLEAESDIEMPKIEAGAKLRAMLPCPVAWGAAGLILV